MNKFNFILIILSVGLWVSACRQGVGTENQAGPANNGAADASLTIFAAASLTDAFTDLGHQFEMQR